MHSRLGENEEVEALAQRQLAEVGLVGASSGCLRRPCSLEELAGAKGSLALAAWYWALAAVCQAWQEWASSLFSWVWVAPRS